MGLHPPGFNYFGPGTDLSKKRKARNPLDRIAKKHDFAYKKVNFEAHNGYAAYLKYNIADANMVKDIERDWWRFSNYEKVLAKIAKGYFKLKKITTDVATLTAYVSGAQAVLGAPEQALAPVQENDDESKESTDATWYGRLFDSIVPHLLEDQLPVSRPDWVDDGKDMDVDEPFEEGYEMDIDVAGHGHIITPIHYTLYRGKVEIKKLNFPKYNLNFII